MLYKCLVLPAIAIFLCVLAPAHCSVVNATAFTTNGSSGLSVSIPSTTAGHTLVIPVQSDQSGTTSFSASATGASFTTRANLSLDHLLSFIQADGISSGITSVTVSPSAFAQFQGFILEVSGTSGFDLVNAGNDNGFGSANPQTTGNITTTNAADCLIAFWSDLETTGGTYSGITSGWTVGTSANSSVYATISESSTGTFSASANYSKASGSARVEAAIIAIELSGSSSSAPGSNKQEKLDRIDPN
jgi:hypothetical protein